MMRCVLMDVLVIRSLFHEELFWLSGSCLKFWLNGFVNKHTFKSFPGISLDSTKAKCEGGSQVRTTKDLFGQFLVDFDTFVDIHTQLHPEKVMLSQLAQ